MAFLSATMAIFMLFSGVNNAQAESANSNSTMMSVNAVSELVHPLSVNATVNASMDATMYATVEPSMDGNMYATVGVTTATPSLESMPRHTMNEISGWLSPTVSHAPVMSTSMPTGFSPMPMESCTVVPSTCICEQFPTISVMSTLVSMAESHETVAVIMTMTSSMNISGSVISYMAPAPSESLPMSMLVSSMKSNSEMESDTPMVSQTLMGSQTLVVSQTTMVSQTPNGSQTSNGSQTPIASYSAMGSMALDSAMASHSQDMVECYCRGHYTACLEMVPSTVDIPFSANTNNDNNPQSVNNGNPWNNEGTTTPAVPSADSTASPIPSADSTASPIPSADSTASPIPSADSTASPIPSADSIASPIPSPIPSADYTASSIPSADYTASSIPSADYTASSIPSADYTASPIPSADSTTSPIPSADYTASNIPSAGSTASPIPSADSTTSPIPSADYTASPIPSADSTASPIPSADYTASPIPSADYTASNIPSADSTASPIPSADYTASPIPSADYTASNIPSADYTASPIPSADSTTSPIPSADSIASPIPSADYTASPVPSADSTTSPIPYVDSIASPIPSADYTASPVPSADSTTSPIPSADSIASPIPSADYTASPVPSADSTTSPIPSADYTASPVPSADSTTSPIPSADYTASPIPSVDSTTSPIPSVDYTASPASHDVVVTSSAIESVAVASSMNVLMESSAIEPSASTMVPSSTSVAMTTAAGPTQPPTLPAVCTNDCTGEPCGQAIINGCGICVLGTTNRAANEGKDCNNVCNGTARNDSCNACTNPLTNDPTGSPKADCYGTCFGIATIDSCGNCSGGRTNKMADFWKDACGLCGGDNITCTGCDGVPNSGKVNDSCGVCAGSGSSCTTISIVVPSLLPTASNNRTVVVYGAGLQGSAIKCVFDGAESTGEVISLTQCKCDIPAEISAGDKSFTVKVVKNGDDTPTKNVMIKIYDATTVKVTQLQPTEIFTKETTDLVFSGNGFFNSSDAVCINNFTKVKAELHGQGYKCSLPAFPKSGAITLALSLNGVHELASDVALARTVFARAPSMTKAQFTDTGALVEVEFDKDVDTTPLGSCADIFDTASVNLLGTSPDCSWSDGQHLTITPGTGVTIVGNSNLGLKANAVKCGGETYSKYASGSVSVTGASNPAQPVSVIIGPSQISSCGHLSLDGSRSSGGGGRDLKYKWSIVSPANGPITAVLNLAQNKTKVFINGTLMSSGNTYKFKLEVQNFLGPAWKESAINVTKSSYPLPEVTVDGPLGGKTLAVNSFYITAMAKAASCSSDKALSFTWTVVCAASSVAKTRVESSSGFKQTSSKSALKIDSGALVGGQSYEFTVVVALKSAQSTATTVKTTVEVEWSPLEPAITGGDRTLGRDSGSLVLDAESSTVDPDNAPGDFSCSWICTDMSNQQPCYSAVNVRNKIALPDLCSITVASTEFTAERSYQITAQVSKGSRIGSSSIMLVVVEGKPPAVTVVTPSVKVVASDKVSLEGKYTSSVKPNVEWVCAQEDNYRYIDLTNNALISSSSHTYNPGGETFTVIVLKGNVLTPGASYKFILNVNDGTKVGSSNMIVEVRSGPTSGTFEVSPTTLQALESVTLKASRWVTDSDAYPLQYEFGFVDGSGIFQPWATQTSNEYTIPAPPGYGPSNTLTLKVKVKDSFGSMKWMGKTITVNPVASIDEGQVEDIINEKLQNAKDTGDYSDVVPNLLSILEVVGGSANTSANLTRKVTNSTVHALIAAVEATSLDEEKAKPILKTFLKLDTTLIQQTKDVLDSFEKVVGATNGNLDESDVDETMKWMAKLATDVDLTDVDVLKDIYAIDNELASSLAKNVDLGQPAVETSGGGTRAVIRVEHSLLIGDVSTESSSGAPKVEFGDEMRGKYGFWECGSGKYCLGVKVKFINYKKDYITGMSSIKPNIVSGEIVSISLQNPQTGAAIPVTGLTKAIDITFKTGSPSAGKTFVGYYYNVWSKKWTTAGLTSTMQGSTLEVTTTHLTSFAPAEEDQSNTTAALTKAPTASIVDNVFQLSFVLSNTTWDADYLNSTHPQYQALKKSILSELDEVYKNDSTFKNSDVEKFEKYGNVVKVFLKMTFHGSNNEPGKKLQDSLANGKLGSISVDKNSVKWVDVHAQTEKTDDDDTSVIIGSVFGSFFSVAIILAVVAWLKNRQSRRKIGSSHSSVNEEPNDTPNPDETPNNDDINSA